MDRQFCESIKAFEQIGDYRAVDRLLRLAQQMELFDPSRYEQTPEEQRTENLRFLPQDYEGYKFGPLYHGSPVINRIMETGLGTAKTPTFGGFNTPSFSENVYFGMNPAIAREYAEGAVQGMMYADVIHNMRDYLEDSDWTPERIKAASEEEYRDFEYDMERRLERSEGIDDYALSASQIAQVIWDALRKEDESGVVEFRSSFEGIRPDEDFIYQLIQYGANQMMPSYEFGRVDYDHMKIYVEQVLRYMVEDILNHMLRDKEITIDAAQKIRNIPDKSVAFDKLLKLIKFGYREWDIYEIADSLGISGEPEMSKFELIYLSIAQDLTGWLRPDVLRALGVISAFSVGKASVPPIPREGFGEHKVRSYEAS